MPVYKRGKKKYRVVISHHGQQLEKIVNGTRKESDSFEIQWKLELDAQAPSKARVAPTFSDFSTGRYRVHAMSELRATTWANRRYEIAELAEHFGEMKLTAIDTAQVEAFRARRSREVGKRSVNRELMCLSAILTYARHVGVPCASPTIRKFSVSRKRRHAEAWTAADVAALYAACEKDDAALLPLLVFLLNTGSRKSEAIAMRWEEVDVKRRLVRIWPRPDDDEDAFDTKSGEAREVPISDALLPFLARAKRPCDWVFPTRSKKRYASFPKKRFAAIVCAAGLTGGPHKSRHTFATHFLASTPDLYLLGRMLGQSTERVTELYAHLLPEQYDRARGAVSLAPTLGPAGVEARKKGWK